MFDVYKEKIEIKDKNGVPTVYEMAPLTGEYLEDFYYIVNAFQAVKPKEGEKEDSVEDIFKILGTDASKKLHKLIFISIEKCYPTIDKETLKMFVTQNMMSFVGPLFSVNLKKD